MKRFDLNCRRGEAHKLGPNYANHYLPEAQRVHCSMEAVYPGLSSNGLTPRYIREDGR